MNSTRCLKNTCLHLWIVTVTVISTLLAGAATADSLTPPAQVSITTQLNEVQRGTFDGRDYLTLHIGGHEVGPSSCRSNILRMDTSSEAGATRQEEIETLALSAMLSRTLVMIVVPLDANQCVDGKPTFTNLYLLPTSP